MNSDTSIRPLTVEIRFSILIVAILVFLAGIQLYVLTEHTDQYFAWTIKSFLTATYLGGGYWASCLPSFIAFRENTWAYLRAAIPGVLVFSTMVLVASLLHFDKFHMHHPAGWAWMIVYAAVPPGLFLMLPRQVRLPGGDPPASRPLSFPIKCIFVLQLLLTLPVGAILFATPPLLIPHWPWALTPLTARTVASAFLTISATSFAVLKENDLRRVKLIGQVYSGYGFLQWIALARYPGEFKWSSHEGWIYLALISSMLVVGIALWFRSSKA
jgi:hypothetical protein